MELLQQLLFFGYYSYVTGNSFQRFLPSTFESPNGIVSTLHSCRKKISSSEEDAVNLTREFKFFTEKIFSEDLKRKKFYDAVEFLDSLIDKLLSESCFLEEQFIFPIFNLITCLNCKSTFGEIVQQQKIITVPMLDQEYSLTIDSLLYFRFFCDVREPDLRTRCSKGCTGRVHEMTILGTAPKLLIINISLNTTSTNFCQTPVEIPSSLNLDGFIGDSYGSINYMLISIVYRYGNNLSGGHFNCALFNRDDTCTVFDDASGNTYSSASVLCDLRRQKHTHIAFYVLERNANSQFYPNDESLLWPYNEEILKVVESIYYDNQPLPPNITERDIFTLLNGEMLNSDIIHTFLTSLVTTKQNLKTEIVSPILNQILQNMGKEEKKSVLIKYLTNVDFLKNDIIFVPINAKSSHWVLLVLYPKEGKGVYLDSLLSFTNIYETLKPIFQNLNTYCQIYGIKKNWRIFNHLLAPQQNNDTDCGLYICINAYKLLHYSDEIKQNLLYRQDENLSVRYWIAYMCIKNKEVLNTTKINEGDKNKILVNLYYEIFFQDITLNVIDVKDCLGGFSYENEWDAFTIANCERENNVNCVEPQLEIESSSRSNLSSDESTDNEEDNEPALEQYKHFFNSWVQQVFDKVKQSRNYHELNSSYRL